MRNCFKFFARIPAATVVGVAAITAVFIYLLRGDDATNRFVEKLLDNPNQAEHT